jgi:predicted nucleotidyltransferase
MISFRSAVTKKLLNHFFINPEENLYVNEISRRLGLDKRNLVKKIKELESEGILKSRTQGNQKLYSVNRKYPLYEEYRRILMKTEGIELRIKSILKSITGVKEAYIYGSYASDSLSAYSDIDLLVIGDHKIVSLQKELVKLQKEIGRELNVVNMDMAEFKKKIKGKDPFISGILSKKHIKVAL